MEGSVSLLNSRLYYVPYVLSGGEGRRREGGEEGERRGDVTEKKI